MKHILLLITCCILSGASYAQIQAGNKYVGGTFNVDIESPKNHSTNTALGFTPTASYFLSDNWMLGISSSFSISYNKGENYTSTGTPATDLPVIRTSDRSVRTIGVGPAMRYYYPVSEKLAFFGESTAKYFTTRYSAHITYLPLGNYYAPDHSSFYMEQKTQYVYASAAPGLVYFVKPKVGLELKATVLSYTHGISKKPAQFAPNFREDLSTQRNFKTNFSLSATSFGIGYYF